MPRPRKDLSIDDIRAQGLARQKKLRAKQTPDQKAETLRRRRELYRLKHPRKHPCIDVPRVEHVNEPMDEPMNEPMNEPEPQAEAPKDITFSQAKDMLTDRNETTYMSNLNTIIANTSKTAVIRKFVLPGKIRDRMLALKNQNGSKPKVNTQKQNIQALINIIRILDITVPAQGLHELKRLMEEYKNVSAEEHEAAPKIPVPWWKDYLLNLHSKYEPTSKESIIARMYKKSPLRDDFKSLVVQTSKRNMDPAKNTIIIPSKGFAEIHLVEFKTKGMTFEEDTITLDKGLSNSLRTYIEDHKIKDDGLLFGKSSLGPFIKKLNTSLGYGADRYGFAPMPINFYRWMSAPELGSTMSAKDKSDKAYQMKHSLASQKKYMRPRLPPDHWK